MKAPYKKYDPALLALYRQNIERVGCKQGYKTILCPYCGKFLWAKGEIVEPNLADETLKRVLERHRKQYPGQDPSEFPPEGIVLYYERVQELGRERGYETTVCPYCGKLLWTKSKILPAKV